MGGFIVGFSIFYVCEFFHSKMLGGREAVSAKCMWACLVQVGSSSPEEGSTDKPSMWVELGAVSLVGIWQIVLKALKMVIAFESSFLLIGK